VIELYDHLINKTMSLSLKSKRNMGTTSFRLLEGHSRARIADKCKIDTVSIYH
jgi:hypothetical protein